MSAKYSYKLTPHANEDMAQALQYISENLHNPQAAIDLLDETEKEIERICTFPYAQPDCTCFLITNPEFRHTQVENYTLVYRIKENEKLLRILFFRYAHMDLIKLFAGFSDTQEG